MICSPFYHGFHRQVNMIWGWSCSLLIPHNLLKDKLKLILYFPVALEHKFPWSLTAYTDRCKYWRVVSAAISSFLSEEFVHSFPLRPVISVSEQWWFYCASSSQARFTSGPMFCCLFMRLSVTCYIGVVMTLPQKKKEVAVEWAEEKRNWCSVQFVS